MKRKAYTKKISSLFKASSKHPEGTAKAFVLLARRILKQPVLEASGKDAEICLGFAADILSQNGLHKAAEKYHDEFVESCRREMYLIGWRLADGTAAAAMNCFQCGKIRKARELAFEALKLFGKFSERSPLIALLGNELQKHRVKASWVTKDRSGGRAW